MNDWKLKIYMDGACPLCSREAKFLKSRDKLGCLAIEDTSVKGFDPSSHGLSTEVDRAIHGKLPDGTVIKGMEVFRRAYAEIGLGWLLAPTGWPVLKPFFDLCYRHFAKNRLRIGKFLGRKCEGSCEVHR